MNPHEIRWKRFVAKVATNIGLQRGTAARCSRELGVSRQTISRWLKGQPMPGWAAVAFNIWANKNNLVTPQADNLVTPEADK